MTSSEPSRQPTTCIVGAGPSGLAAARVFAAKGLPFEVFERHDSIGGLWAADNPGTPLYESAHFISSKTMSGFPGYPMPDDYPDYPRGDQILAYLRSFVGAYGLDQHITTGCGVRWAEWGDEGWDVELENGETRTFDHLVCANGTQWHPAMPDIPGDFSGQIYHSKEYSSIDQLRGQRVLVIGAGNSGVDIACDAAGAAGHASISMRRGYHFISKHILGVPSDVFGSTGPELPLAISQRVFARLLRTLVGRPERYGLPKPDHKLFETHPILNTEIFHYLSHGDLTVRRDVASFDGPTVRFVDGTEDEFDVVICATGYNTRVPYLDDRHFEWRMGRPRILMNTFVRDNPRLFAVGFTEGDGGGFPNFDIMADAVANTVALVGPVGSKVPASWTRFRRVADPNITGDVKLLDLPRHAAYLHESAFRSEMERIGREFGWPDRDPARYDKLR